MNSLPYFKNFISYLRRNNYSDETVYNYERDLKTFQKFLAGKTVEFQKITKQTIEDYKSYLASGKRKTAEGQETLKKLSNFSINRMLSSLRVYLKYLIDHINYNLPISSETIKMTKCKRKSQQDIKLEDQLKLIESPTKFERNKIVALRNRAILEIIFATGIRISELTTLKKNQFDKTGRIFIQSKENKKRVIYLTPRAQRHLKNYLVVQRETNSPYLFIPLRGKNASNENKKISPNYLQGRIKRYRGLLGLNIVISADSLRYPFNTYLREQEANPPIIQVLFSHESLNIATRYIHYKE